LDYLAGLRRPDIGVIDAITPLDEVYAVVKEYIASRA
jgi:hypothetical protein